MPEHPAGYLLEQVAAGLGDDETVRHVHGCPACAAYVERLSAASERFAAGSEAEAFADAVVSREARTRGVGRGTVAAIALPLVAAVAAGVFFWVHPVSAPVLPGPSAVALAPTAPSDVRFKGAPQIAVIRERDGQQVRMGVEVGIRAHDRVRVEISLDGPALIEIGILSADGSWATLQPAEMLTAGTHYTPQAVKFDEAPTSGWVLAGAPEAVRRARESRDFRDVVVLPLHLEPAP